MWPYRSILCILFLLLLCIMSSIIVFSAEQVRILTDDCLKEVVQKVESCQLPVIAQVSKQFRYTAKDVAHIRACALIEWLYNNGHDVLNENCIYSADRLTVAYARPMIVRDIKKFASWKDHYTKVWMFFYVTHCGSNIVCHQTPYLPKQSLTGKVPMLCGSIAHIKQNYEIKLQILNPQLTLREIPKRNTIYIDKFGIYEGIEHKFYCGLYLHLVSAHSLKYMLPMLYARSTALLGISHIDKEKGILCTDLTQSSLLAPQDLKFITKIIPKTVIGNPIYQCYKEHKNDKNLRVLFHMFFSWSNYCEKVQFIRFFDCHTRHTGYFDWNDEFYAASIKLLDRWVVVRKKGWFNRTDCAKKNDENFYKILRFLKKERCVKVPCNRYGYRCFFDQLTSSLFLFQKRDIPSRWHKNALVLSDKIDTKNIDLKTMTINLDRAHLSYLLKGINVRKYINIPSLPRPSLSRFTF